MPDPQRPPRPFEVYDVTVEASEAVTPRTKHIRFRLAPGRELRFRAGQFVQMFIPSSGGGTRRTAYSIASSPRETSFFDLCVTRVDGGESSEYLHKLKIGDRTQALGPLGSFLFVGDGRDSVFVATGSGIAPFRAMIPELLAGGGREVLYLLFGNRYEEDISYRAEWEALAREHPNFKVLHTLSRGGWGGPRGYVQDHVQGFVPEPASKNFYLCGLKAMISSVEAKLLSLGVPKDRIRFERFD